MDSPQLLAEFEWGTRLVDGLFPEQVTGWIRRGGPAYQRPSQGWLTAHDVYHHLSNDQGSYAEEVASFGAQAWTDPQLAPEHPRSVAELATIWFSVMAMILEGGTRGVRGLLLPEPPACESTHPLMPLLRQGYTQALWEVQDVFSDWATDEEWKLLGGHEQTQRAAAWAVHGYETAKVRWPDISLARAGYDQLAKLAQASAQDGDVLRVSLPASGELLIEHSAVVSAPAPRRRLG